MLALPGPSLDDPTVHRKLGPLLLILCACGGATPANESGAAAPTSPPNPAPAPTAAAPPAESASATASASAPPNAPAPTLPPPPKVVLHAGDSMVGGPGGLARALDAKFKPYGTVYVRDWRVATVQTFDYQNYFGKLLAKHKPDMVILNLGANDVFVPNPKSLAGFVASIARKASADGRRCFWITPPLWKPPDTGIVDVIKTNARGCSVFDSSALVLPKWPDGIHPNNEGGAIWADRFWEFYRDSANAAPASGALALTATAGR